MEQTFVIFKPDCLEKGKVGTVLARFEDAGFQIRACKMIKLTPEMLGTHYAHIADKPFFPSVADFMGSRAVIMVILAGENIIERVRDLLGPTDSTKAEKGTIRGDFGEDVMKNICHASDGPETAEAEIARFFSIDQIYA